MMMLRYAHPRSLAARRRGPAVEWRLNWTVEVPSTDGIAIGENGQAQQDLCGLPRLDFVSQHRGFPRFGRTRPRCQHVNDIQLMT